MARRIRPIRFENHFAKRVIEVFFDEGFEISSREDLEHLKSQWTDNLKKWHSPYTCVLDCRTLIVAEDLQPDFTRLIDFFKKFFMKKIVGFATSQRDVAELQSFPFPVAPDYETAIAETGLGRSGGLSRDLSRLRDRIQIDNDFSAHVMEISFLAPTDFDTDEDLKTLRGKLQNALIQWHTPYSLVFNIADCRFSESGRAAFAAVERFLRAFFCQAIVGYGPAEDPSSYPFKVYRSRHKAVGTLNHQGLQSGETANCSTRRIKQN
jgi:hypothetical protein